MSPKTKTVQNDPVYVGVYDSSILHKTILESTKSIIELVRDYKHIDDIRKKKKDVIGNFDDTIAHIKSDMSNLKSALPLDVAKPIINPMRPKPSTVKHTRTAQLDDLDKELAAIEAKLSKFSN